MKKSTLVEIKNENKEPSSDHELDRMDRRILNILQLEKKMQDHPEIKQCYFISGDADYLLVVHATDMNHYNEFARRVFASEPNIKMFRSSFCLNRIKYNTHFQLEEK